MFIKNIINKRTKAASWRNIHDGISYPINYPFKHQENFLCVKRDKRNNKEVLGY